ncbi:MAG: hypothetical protein K8T26_15775 [Lentisphaerae bacterium]|nr:hypothetical protein [Lentisphaerota bacterium]
MRLHATPRDIVTGLIVFPLGDSIGALLTGQFGALRFAGMMALGAILYAWEIPAYFRWIDRRTPDSLPPGRRAVLRTGLAMLYFNPLWIARHLAFIAAFMAQWDALRWSLLRTATLSWAFNIPVALVGNFVIQMKLPLRHRFLGSATFSAIMVVYYALSRVMFQ